MADNSDLQKIQASEKPTSDDFEYAYVETVNKAFVRIAKERLKEILGANRYTNEEIDQKLSTIPKFNIEVVSSLPTTDISETTIYLVSSGDDSENLYTEYININGLWEILGTQKSTFSGNASDVSYDDTETKLGATNVQEAVGRLSATVNDLKDNQPTTGSGVTTAQANSLWAIVQKTAFAEALTDSELTAFKNAWGIENGGEEEPDIPVEPDVPEEVIYYSITRNLTNYTSSSDVTTVVKGEAHNETLTVVDGYESSNVTITMSGVDITDSVYGDGYILITEVTGDIVITAIATEPIVNTAHSLKAGNTVTFYSTSDDTTQLSNAYYGSYGVVTDIATKNSIAKITITNNTSEVVGKNTSIYVGQTKYYPDGNTIKAYDSNLAYTISSVGIESGNSITFTANVSKGYLLIFTNVVGCDIKVENIITDASYDTDIYTVLDYTQYTSGTQVVYYSDEGETKITNKYYAKYLASNNAFETDTDVIVIVTNSSGTDTEGGIYIGEVTPTSIGGATVNMLNCIEMAGTKFGQYAYVEKTITVKAGNHIAITNNDSASVTFKVKVVE